jgi:hypothetical protein
MTWVLWIALLISWASTVLAWVTWWWAYRRWIYYSDLYFKMLPHLSPQAAAVFLDSRPPRPWPFDRGKIKAPAQG